MPQKRNPIACEFILACAKNVRQLVPVMLDAMVQDHERATGPWHAEWIALPQAFALTAGALHHARALLEGLIVDPERMRRNLDATRGMITAEAVMMALAPRRRPRAGASPGRRGVPARRSRRGRASARGAAAPSRGHGASAPERTRRAARPRAATPGLPARSSIASSRRCQQIRLKGGVMPKIQANGIQLHYELSGPADAPVVMLSNSLGTRLEMWDPQMPALTERYRVLRYDSRGHGRSRRARGPVHDRRCWPTTRSACSMRSASSACISAGCRRAAWSARCSARSTASGC